MKKVPSILLSIVISTSCFAQEFDSAAAQTVRAKNSFYIEGLGNGLVYSLNYDRLFMERKKTILAARIGASWFPSGGGNYRIGALGELNLLYGKGKHFLETGLGLSYMYLDDYYWLTDEQGTVLEVVDQKLHWLFATGRFGYRYQKPEGGFFFRAAFTPVFQFYDKREDKYGGLFSQPDPAMTLQAWGGISIGYTLRK